MIGTEAADAARSTSSVGFAHAHAAGRRVEVFDPARRLVAGRWLALQVFVAAASTVKMTAARRSSADPVLRC